MLMLISQLLFLCYTNYQNLNTSNVNVNLPSNSTGFILQRNLNTSNVNVNLNTSLCYIPVTGI